MHLKESGVTAEEFLHKGNEKGNSKCSEFLVLVEFSKSKVGNRK